MKTIKILILNGLVVFGLTTLSACGSALPVKNTNDELTLVIRHAEDAAARAKKSAQESELHRREADQVYLDAKLLYAKTIAAQERMEQLLKKIPPRKLIVKCAPPKKPKEEVVEAPKVVEPPKPVYPQYSPSDAPLGVAPLPARVGGAEAGTQPAIPDANSLFAPPAASAGSAADKH